MPYLLPINSSSPPQDNNVGRSLSKKKKKNFGCSSLFGRLLDVKEHLMKLHGWFVEDNKSPG
jgi:hypothetical protein